MPLLENPHGEDINVLEVEVEVEVEVVDGTGSAS